ncbi:hypothetical protein F5Y18DRAFT_370433 [Xylariaceae sp. FL1019]|nr:hypothetical protein F5Y18DRAFT_370433 [Xylariaceae sp. FL1019]
MNPSISEASQDMAEEAGVPPLASKRFECAVSGCDKVFRRKEHLTRHMKTHDKQLQYACHICGKRYARSDVLKRHIEFHPRYYKPKRSFAACNKCRESKTRCDESDPCTPCSRKSIACGRPFLEPIPTIPHSELSPSDTDPVPLGGTNALAERIILGRYDVRHLVTWKRLQVYFSRVHHIWPVLDARKFAPDDCPDVLLAAIVLLASWLEGSEEHSALAPILFDKILDLQLLANTPLYVLEAMVLYLIYGLCRLATEDMALKAIKMHNALVTACRIEGIFDAQKEVWNTPRREAASLDIQEQRQRIAFATLRVDAYLCAMTSLPSAVTPQELSMPLSQATQWAEVDSEEEREALLEKQPAMRKKTAFAFLVIDLFGVPRQNSLAPRWTKVDYHFLLCAMQSDCWGSTYQALRSVVDELYSRSHPLDARTLGRDRLQRWLINCESDCQLRTNYFSTAPSDKLTPQTLLLYHIASLKLYSPLDLLQLPARYYRWRDVDIPDKDNSRPYLQPWQLSKVARMAVWHGAQIARIVSKELALESASSQPEYSSSRLLLNPLAIPGLLMSGGIICGYMHNLFACPLCTGAEAIDLVNIWEAGDPCPRMAAWKESGVGLAQWGPDNFNPFPVCQCGLDRMALWFQRLLTRDKRAEAAIVQFLDELKNDLW